MPAFHPFAFAENRDAGSEVMEHTLQSCQRLEEEMARKDKQILTWHRIGASFQRHWIVRLNVAGRGGRKWKT